MISRRGVWLIAAGIIGVVAVICGAAATHMFRADPRQAAFVGTAAQYGMYHALALLGLVALDGDGGRSRLLGFAGWCFLLGALLFSGSLLLLAATGLAGFGYATPVGGILVILGWAALALYGAVRLRGAPAGQERGPPR
jgi:uncharacterized membrane protein YgdD (TMEM256/DUF423 family)